MSHNVGLTMLPPRLYHYTDYEGLIGIIESQTLWATDIGNLNDTTEIAYSREMLGRLSEKLSAESEPSYALNLVCMAASAMSISPTTPEMFVASLSDDEDNLSQWRGYASQGHGFAISFDRANLEEIALTQGFTMVPILYDREEQEEHILQALAEAVHILRDWGDDPSNAPSPDQQVLSLGLGLTIALMFVKNSYFRDEREWRFIRLVVPGVWDQQALARERNETKVLYEKIKFADGASGKGRDVGQSLRPDRNAAGIEQGPRGA